MRIDYKKYNYCKMCNKVYPKDVMVCPTGRHHGNLRTKPRVKVKI